jgi:type IV pilus assembly protein PilC
VSDVYQYRVRDHGGKMMSGTLVADNQQLVVARLREMGYVPLSVSVHRAGLKREIRLRRKVRIKDLAVFSRQFATMVNAGLPILKSLSILEQQSESAILVKAVAEMRREIERGSSLSVAMSKHPKVFSQLYVSMVRSGETGGVLESVLERLASNLEREVSLRHRIRSAMTYPVVVVCFVMMILTAMLLFIVPQFKSIYATLGGAKLPFPTQVLLKVSDIFKKYFVLVVLAVVGLVYAGRRYTRTERGRYQWDRLKLRFPIFGPLFKKTALARFARVLGVLNRSGVPILQSLDVVSETVNNSLMARAIKDVQDSVKQGESLAKPLAKHELFPPMVVQMLTVGEETGALDTMLEKMATFYDEEVTASVDALTSLIEPVLIFIVGGAVGMAVIALYLPMFNIINLIK